MWNTVYHSSLPLLSVCLCSTFWSRLFFPRSYSFCCVRPPGHHAEMNKPGGFCFLNNAGIAAKYAQHKYGVQKVAVLDFDVHHGNGKRSSSWFDSLCILNPLACAARNRFEDRTAYCFKQPLMCNYTTPTIFLTVRSADRCGGWLQRGQHAFLRQYAREGQLPRDGGGPLPQCGPKSPRPPAQTDR